MWLWPTKLFSDSWCLLQGRLMKLVKHCTLASWPCQQAETRPILPSHHMANLTYTGDFNVSLNFEYNLRWLSGILILCHNIFYFFCNMDLHYNSRIYDSNTILNKLKCPLLYNWVFTTFQKKCVCGSHIFHTFHCEGHKTMKAKKYRHSLLENARNCNS